MTTFEQIYFATRNMLRIKQHDHWGSISLAILWSGKALLLLEGMSIRSVERVTGVHRDNDPALACPGRPMLRREDALRDSQSAICLLKMCRLMRLPP
jgi:hypothetical protein